MKIIGITGVIGSGKSTYARHLLRRRGYRGFRIIDADAVVRQVRMGIAYPQIVRAFPCFAAPDGLRRLREAVFADPHQLRLLESILHPLVRAEIHRQMTSARTRRQPGVLLDIPLLFENGWVGVCDEVRVVATPPQERLRRLWARSGLDAASVEAIDAQQWPLGRKMRQATHVVRANRVYRTTVQRSCRNVRLVQK